MVRASLFAAASALLSVAGASAAVVDVIPVTGHDRDYMMLSRATAEQPTWDGTQPVSANADEYDYVEAYGNRWGYIDFGEDWANIRITEVWTRYRNWSTGNTNIFQEYGWATTWDTWNIPTLIPETQIKLSSQTALPYHNEPWWARDVDLNASPVTPAGRLLFVHTMDPGSENLRAAEFAFIGYTEVPEPASLAALGTCLVLLARRRGS